jgi:type IV secretion system protein VirB4
MLPEFRREPKSFPDLLNYYALVDEGVLFNKDGSLLAGWWYAGPDMESATPNEMAVLAEQVNGALRDLGNGWMIQADAIRKPAAGYPEAAFFPDPTSLLIDEERRRVYESGEATFESLYAFTVSYLPPPEMQNRLSALFIDSDEEDRAPSWETALRHFQRATTHLEDALSDRLSLERMDSGDLLGFLASCASGVTNPVRVPHPPLDLDAIIGSQDLIGGFELRVGRLWVRPIAISGFPSDSFPGILDFLNRLSLEYRWSNRFISVEPTTAVQLLKRTRRNWFQKRYGLAGLIREAMQMGGQTFANQDAVMMAEDADAAIAEASRMHVRFGHYTSVVLLRGEDRERLELQSRQVERELQHNGFKTRVETINALEAFLGTLPGHGFRNVRRPLLHTLNFADLIPTTSICPGLEQNPCPFFPPGSPPLLYANTAGATPFRFNLHVSDVGHTMVIGPTGAGKSTLIGLIAAQFLRYPGAQVFAFDKGYSSFALCNAVGGIHYDIAGDHGDDLAFCPLANIHEASVRIWASEWIEHLLALQQVTITPQQRKQIHAALERLVESPDRTLTHFVSTVQDDVVRSGLRHYTLEGAMGYLLDAERDGLQGAHFQVFEVEHLMNKGEQNAVPVLLYLFHQIERRLTGQPSLLILEEAWLLLNHPVFSSKIEEWLRVLRKRNCAVVFVSQSLTEVFNSPQRDLLLESCRTKVFLPNPEARSSQTSHLYRQLGLNETQVELVAHAIPKRHYYYVSELGRRMLDLALGPETLSFIGISGTEEIEHLRKLRHQHGDQWPAVWLEQQGLAEAAAHWKQLSKEYSHAAN